MRDKITSHLIEYLYSIRWEQKKITNKMSIKRTIITTIVALALVAVVAPVVTQATTISDLMAQIAALQAQLTGLSGTNTTTGTGNCAGVTFTRNLTVGTTGSDVKCLQTILNGSTTTQVAVTGAGSPGHETTTFGPATLKAVKKYQTANGFTPANQVGPATRAKLNAAVAAMGGTVPPPPGGTPYPTPTPVAGSISAMVASDSPASGALIGNEASADLLHVNFTGTGTVTSVTLQRSGISDQNTLTNVYLYDGNTRLTDGYSFNINGQLVMNGLAIAVNGSHTISVRGDVSGLCISQNTCSSVAVALTGYKANGTTSSASVTGNTQMIVTGSAASIYLGANTVYSGNSLQTINAGTSQYTVWSAPLQVNTRAVMLKMADFKMIGSAPTTAVSNVRLFINGVDTGKVATVISIGGSNYANFDLTSSPITLTTGSSTVDVRADIVSGAARTVQFSVQQASDLTVTDPQVGVNIATLGVAGATFSANVGANISIAQGSGSVVVDPTFTSATTVSAGATNSVIGRFTIHGYGEDVKVSSIQVSPEVDSATTTGGTCTTNANGTFLGGTTGVCGLNNVTLYFNGSQIGSQQSYTLTTSSTNSPLTYQLGSQMIVPAGTDATLEVRADLQTTGNIAYTGGIVRATLTSATSNGTNAQGQSSQNSIAVPTAPIVTNGLTVSSATLAVSANTSYTSQAVSPNSANVKIGSYIVQNQSTSESIRLTTLTVNLTSNGTVALGTSALTGLTSLRTSDTTGSGSTPIQPAASNTFSVSDTLAPGASMVIDILANTGSATTLPQVVTRLTVASIGASSNISSAGTIQTGQTMSLSTGTLEAPAVIVSSTTPSQYIASSSTTGATNSAQVTYNFVSDSGTSTISELKFAVVQGNGSVTGICVTPTGGSAVCAQPVNGVADITNLTLPVLNNGGLAQNVQVSYAPVGTYGQISGQTSQISLIYIKYQSGGTTSVACPATVTPAGNAAVTCTHTDTNNVLSAAVSAPAVALVGSVPTVTVASTSNSGLQLNTAAANQQIGQVTIAANASGAIRVRTITFSVGNSGFSTTSMTMIGVTPTLDIGSTPVTGAACSTTDGYKTVVCKFTADGTYAGAQTYASDFIISAGQSQTFNLYSVVNGATNGSTTASVSSSVSATGFVWDDTSWNGVSHGVGLLGQDTTPEIIYNFPTSSCVLHQ